MSLSAMFPIVKPWYETPRKGSNSVLSDHSLQVSLEPNTSKISSLAEGDGNSLNLAVLSIFFFSFKLIIYGAYFPSSVH
jgi:hypothetical protein